MKFLTSCAALLALSHIKSSALGQPEQAISQLKSQLNAQQQRVVDLQAEVSSLLRDISAAKGHSVTAGSGGISLNIKFPGQESKAENAPFGSNATAGASAVLESTGPIPVMVVKPSSVADVEDALEQVLEQEAAFSGQSKAENEIPMSSNIQAPEDIIDQAIAKIDELESQKTHYKYDSENVRRNYIA